MKQNFFKRFISKIIAKQLRKPSGLLAGKVGNEMNKTNRFLYDFTKKAMEIKDYQTILEIGFGNGIFFNQVFSAANNLQIAGLDFSKEMVKAANRNNVTNIDAGKLSLQAGSSDKIPFRDNSFDKVFLHQCHLLLGTTCRSSKRNIPSIETWREILYIYPHKRKPGKDAIFKIWLSYLFTG